MAEKKSDQEVLQQHRATRRRGGSLEYAGHGAKGRDREMVVGKRCRLAAGAAEQREEEQGKTHCVGDEEGGGDCPSSKELQEGDTWRL